MKAWKASSSSGDPSILSQVLGAKPMLRIVAEYYGVTDEGNFEGMSILNVPAAPSG